LVRHFPFDPFGAAILFTLLS